MRITREAGGRLTKVIGLLHVIGIAALVLQLFAGRRVLSLLSQGRSSAGDVWPAAAGVVVGFAVSAAVAAAVTAAQRALSERVSRQAVGVVLQRTSETDLIDFETSDFHDYNISLAPD